jgi:hypothetical protein
LKVLFRPDELGIVEFAPFMNGFSDFDVLYEAFAV